MLDALRDAVGGLLAKIGVEEPPWAVAAVVTVAAGGSLLLALRSPRENEFVAALPSDIRQHVIARRKEFNFMYHHVEQDYFSSGGINVQVPQNAVIVDVGGHIGMFTLHSFIRSGCTAKIFSFEPVPQNREKLVETVRGLDPAGKNIRVYPYGLSDRTGTVSFDYIPAASALSSYKKDGREEVRNECLSPEFIVRNFYETPAYEHLDVPAMFNYIPRFLGEPLLHFLIRKALEKAGKDPVPVTCELRKLSDVLAEEAVGPRIDLLKVDVEGAEIDVIRGISKDDWAKIQMAVIEVGNTEGNVGPVREILVQNGLTDIVETQENDFQSMGVWLVTAKRP